MIALDWPWVLKFSSCCFALGVGLSHQRRLPTQQWTPNWDHHQTPPHRGHGCRPGPAQHRHLGRVRENARSDLKGRSLSSAWMMFNEASVCVWQVSGAVQAGQSVREIHAGSREERQQRVLQAQEQPAAGGVGAHDGIVQLPRHFSSAAPECSDWGRFKHRNHHPLRNLSSQEPSSQCPPWAQKWECSYLACRVVLFLSPFSLFLSDLLWHHHSCNHVPLFWRRKPSSGLHATEIW